MGKRSALWRRLITRFHNGRSSSNNSLENSDIGNRLITQLSFPSFLSSISTTTQEAFVCGPTTPERRQADQQVELHLTPFARNFNNSLRQLAAHIPKCLRGLNSESFLQGEPSYENFSRNCWLENHLHRFGGIDSDTDNRRQNNVHIIDEHFDSNSNATGTISSTGSSSINCQDNLNLDTSSSSRISNGSTVSDITQLYNNMNIDDSSFCQHAGIPIENPPPYSETHEDPPPPYTELFDSQPSQSRSYSSQNDNFTFLW